MRAAVFDSPVAMHVADVPDLQPRPGEVLCRVEAAGICGSDLHGYRAGGHIAPTKGFGYPRTAPGHELAGTVIALGGGVTSLALGDRVGIEPLCGCDACEWCAIGEYHLCPQLEHIGGARSGGFAEITRAPAKKCFKLPDHVSFEEASTLDCLAVAVHALHRVPVHPQDTVAVFGTGAIGLFTAAAARAVGARQVIVVGGHRETPLKVARDMGAHVTVNASQEDPVEAILRQTDGRGADVVFETVGGRADTLAKSLASARRGGVVGIEGSFQDPQPVDMGLQMRREISILWCWSYAMWGSVPEYKIALDMLADGRVKAAPMITHRFPLAQVEDAFAAAGHKELSDAIKVCIMPSWS